MAELVGKRLLVSDLPADTLRVSSGLFSALPRDVVVLPVLFEGQIKAVIELASLNVYTASHLAFLDQLTSSIGINLSSVEATMQTEALLVQSQKLRALGERPLRSTTYPGRSRHALPRP